MQSAQEGGGGGHRGWTDHGQLVPGQVLSAAEPGGAGGPPAAGALAGDMAGGACPSTRCGAPFPAAPSLAACGTRTLGPRTTSRAGPRLAGTWPDPPGLPPHLTEWRPRARTNQSLGQGCALWLTGPVGVPSGAWLRSQKRTGGGHRAAPVPKHHPREAHAGKVLIKFSHGPGPFRPLLCMAAHRRPEIRAGRGREGCEVEKGRGREGQRRGRIKSVKAGGRGASAVGVGVGVVPRPGGRPAFSQAVWGHSKGGG